MKKPNVAQAILQKKIDTGARTSGDLVPAHPRGRRGFPCDSLMNSFSTRQASTPKTPSLSGVGGNLGALPLPYNGVYGAVHAGSIEVKAKRKLDLRDWK